MSRLKKEGVRSSAMCNLLVPEFFSTSVGSGVADMDFRMAILIWDVASLTRIGECLGVEEEEEGFLLGRKNASVITFWSWGMELMIF
jgi:hypothetical protein